MRLDARLALSRYVFGRLLYDTGQNARAVIELEAARALASEEAQIHYALARAYSRVNRKQDAERAREIFARLSKKADAATNAAAAGGGDSHSNPTQIPAPQDK